MNQYEERDGEEDRKPGGRTCVMESLGLKEEDVVDRRSHMMGKAWVRKHRVTRAPINLLCGYCYNSASVPLVTLLVLRAWTLRRRR